jgi:propanol-preferring alcohol dehydrogenase
VVGTSVGTSVEMQELFDMALKGEVVPRVEIFEFDQINSVIDKLAQFQIEGRCQNFARIGLTISIGCNVY